MPRILVIDDDDMLRELLTLSLEMEGYETDVAENGAAGLEALRRERPDLIILDLMMPVMDGLRFLRCLPEWTRPLPPVVVLSAVGQQEHEQELHSAGATAIIRKPVDVTELVVTVRRALDISAG